LWRRVQAKGSADLQLHVMTTGDILLEIITQQKISKPVLLTLTDPRGGILTLVFIQLTGTKTEIKK